MGDLISISVLNDLSWYEQEDLITIDRMSLLVVVGCIELALRHPQYPSASSVIAKAVGITLVTHLLDNGIVVSDEVRNAWETTFDHVF